MRPFDELTSERDGLRRQVDAMLNYEVGEWLAMERTLGGGIGDYEGTVSWKITKPLRLARQFQYAVRGVGARQAIRLAVGFAARRNGR